MKTILLIEDNAEMLENLSEYLEMEGYKVLMANTGMKGVHLAKKFKPDLIICDVLMPGMNGYEVLQTVLNIPTTAKIPFIFSTSMSEITDKAEAMKQGADDYIVKPFEPETLLKMIKVLTGSGKKSKTLPSKKFRFNSFGAQLYFLNNSISYPAYF